MQNITCIAKFASKTQRIQVRNGQYVGVQFIIPVIVGIHDTLVSEIHENVDLVLGIKNTFELEGVIDMHESYFKLKKEKEEAKENYPWLDKNDVRKYMTDREILDKYIDLEKSCLTEKNDGRDRIYKCKDAFSLRHEIGTCPNIEFKMDTMDKMPFFIRP